MLSFLSEISKSPEALVGISAFLATFISSVMADEQKDRLKQGTFGAIAGTFVGGLAAVINNKSALVLIGIFGSAAGAIIGWIVYLGLSIVASWPWGRRLVDYHVTGLKGVRDQLDLDERDKLLTALNVWSQNFRGMVLRETHVILSIKPSADYNDWVKIAIRGWLTSLIDAFNLVLDALAEKPDYKSRVTVIVFGTKSGQPVGRHWISWAGPQQSHTKRDFDKDSIAYQVLSGQKESPYFTSIERALKEGQEREIIASYSSFFVFRLNDNAVLSLDWPGKLKAHDAYVNVAKSLLQLDVAPAIGDLLDKWSGDIAAEMNLAPLAPSTEAGLAPPGPLTPLPPRKTTPRYTEAEQILELDEAVDLIVRASEAQETEGFDSSGLRENLARLSRWANR